VAVDWLRDIELDQKVVTGFLQCWLVDTESAPIDWVFGTVLEL